MGCQQSAEPVAPAPASLKSVEPTAPEAPARPPRTQRSEFAKHIRKYTRKGVYESLRFALDKCSLIIELKTAPHTFAQAHKYIDEIPNAVLAGFRDVVLKHHAYFKLPCSLGARVSVDRVTEGAIEVTVSWGETEA